MASAAWKEQNQDKIRAYRRAWYYRNREQAKAKASERKQQIKEWFKGYKCQLFCRQCGENNGACLQFHHLDSKTKDTSLAEMVHDGWGQQKILKEIEKCEVLCA